MCIWDAKVEIMSCRQFVDMVCEVSTPGLSHAVVSTYRLVGYMMMSSYIYPDIDVIESLRWTLYTWEFT